MTYRIAIIVGFIAYGLMSVSARADELFTAPLIVGASVSAGHGTLSPGHRAALRHTTSDYIMTVAQGGATSLDIVPRLSADMIVSRSIVIGVDLFFWDSTLENSDESLRHLSWIIDTSHDAGVPLVLGNIPSLLPGLQPQQSILNRAMGERCLVSLRCYILDLEAFHRKIERDGFIEIRGKRYTMGEIIPDGLHLSEIASEHIADQIEALVTPPS